MSGIYKYQCYLYIQMGHSWYEALSFCESKHSYLAEVTDPEERDAVWNYAKGNISSGGSKGGVRDTRPPYPKFLHFYAVFGKNWPNNRPRVNFVRSGKCCNN